MKNSETERELTELIKSTLDNYQEDYIPGAWENFANNRKKRGKIILWRIGAGIAASLLIGWLVLNFNQSDPSVKPNHTIVKYSPEIPVLKDMSKETSQNQSVSSGNEKAILKNMPESKALSQGIFNSQLKKIVLQDSLNTIINTPIVVNHLAPNQGPNFNDSVVTKMITMSSPTDTLNTALASSTNSTDSIKTAFDMKTSGSPKYRSTDEQLNPQKIAENNVPNISTKRKIRFGLNFSPGINSTQTGSSFNYSGGINTDFALFSNFQLSTGLQIEHQSVVNNTNNNTSVPRGQSKADLVNLDLPLNITWKFFSNKSKSYYVSGGVSSLAFLSEKYNKTSYTQHIVEARTMAGGVESLTYQVENIESTEQKTESPFHAFDIAGRVNFLFGMEQRISSKLFIHVEPYIKIPVSGLATQNLKFTTSGITCKISF